MNDSIFEPNYTVTDEITIRLENIDRNKWLVDRVLLMPKYEAWLHRDVRVGRAVGTTRIEGARLDQAAVARLEHQGISKSNDADEQDNINALQAYDFIDFVSDQADIPVDELVIRQLNRLFIAHASSVLTPGVYRKGQNRAGNFQPPDQGDVPGLMRSFALWLRQDGGEVHPVLKAGIAHLHMIAIHSFWDGNGRTARGLEMLLLQRSEFGFRKLLSLELGLSVVRDDYIRALDLTLGDCFGPGYDATPWLEFSTRMLQSASDQLVASLTDWHRMMETASGFGEEAGLEPRQTDALMFAALVGPITRGDYVEIARVSLATASRDLARLVKIGLLEVEGKTRSRVYRAASLGDRTPSRDVPEEQLPLISDNTG